jgi:hypothetical protein
MFIRETTLLMQTCMTLPRLSLHNYSSSIIGRLICMNGTMVSGTALGSWLCLSASIRLLPFGGRYKAGLQPEILGGFFLCVICFLSFISTYLCSIYTLSSALSSLYSLFFTIFLLPSFFCILLSIVLYLLSTVYLWLPILSYSSSNTHSLTPNGCHMLIAIRSSLFSTPSSP